MNSRKLIGGTLLLIILIIVIYFFTSNLKFAQGVKEDVKIRDSIMKVNGITDTSQFIPEKVYKEVFPDSIIK